MDMITLAMAKAYTDSQRLASAETCETVLLPEMLLNDFKTSVAIEKDIIVGETYTVIFDGVKYEVKAEFYEDVIFDENITYIGEKERYYTRNYMGGYPFAVVFNHVTNERAVCVYDDGKTHTIFVYTETETIHPIDPKYLGGVCLPVVEITSAEYPTDGTVELSAEESAQIDKVVANSEFVIVKMQSGLGVPVGLMFTAIEGIALVGVNGEKVLAFSRDDTIWTMGG